MEIISKAIKYEIPIKQPKLFNVVKDLYDNFNKKEFDTNITVEECMLEPVKFVYNGFNQITNFETVKTLEPIELPNSMVVLLAFSGGLDSVYQALKLRDRGYAVRLFHVKNMNFYSNGQEYKAAKNFAKDFSFELIEASMSPIKDAGEYKKYWKENPFKNEVFYSMMLDYAAENGINNISSGDDLRLQIEDAVPDTNFSDIGEFTSLFMEGASEVYKNFHFLPIIKANKAERLKFLKEKNALDYYYSCVGAGRLQMFLNKKNSAKYGVKLDKLSCGCSCRKDSFHILLKYYFLNEVYPQEFIDKCWDCIAKGADAVFFNKSIPLEKRIQNLIDY